MYLDIRPIKTTVRSKAEQWVERLKFSTTEDANYKTTSWCNKDLIPLPRERRTWIWIDFMAYWIIAGISPNSWSIGSGMLQIGLNVAQTIAIIVAGSIINAVLSLSCGWPGSHQHIGFAIMSRSSWGIRGAFLPLLNRAMTGIVWMGLNLYWGGQAVRIILGGLIGPKIFLVENSLPLSANITTVELISFFLFVLILVPFLLIKLEDLKLPLKITFAAVVALLVGMLSWTISADEGVGPIWEAEPIAPSSSARWDMMFGLQYFLGVYGGYALSQSDWTRYSKHPNHALVGHAVVAPVILCLTSVSGILIASASSGIYSEPYWNPFLLLLRAQSALTAVSRTGTILLGLCILANQLAICIALNSSTFGLDFTALLPMYIDQRRGSYLAMIVAIAICPWNLVQNPDTFVLVLNGWSVFLAPMTALSIADYFFVRRCQLQLPDLFVGNSTSIYWYFGGFNIRTIIAWLMGVSPMLPGFIRSVRGENLMNLHPWDNPWDELYLMNYILGFSFAFVTHLVLHYAFPAKMVSTISHLKIYSKDTLAKNENRERISIG